MNGLNIPNSWIGILRRRRKPKDAPRENPHNKESELSALHLAAQIIGISCFDTFREDLFSTEFIAAGSDGSTSRSVLRYDFVDCDNESTYTLSTQRRCLLMPFEAEFQVFGHDYSKKKADLSAWRSLAESELKLVLNKAKSEALKQTDDFYASMMNVDIAGAQQLIQSNLRLLINLQKFILANHKLNKNQLLPFMEQVDLLDKSVVINMKRSAVNGNYSYAG
jgi:hypothetical protein